METLTQAIYELATAMLAPVLVMLLSIFGWALFMFGSFLREWQQRRHAAKTGLQSSVKNCVEELRCNPGAFPEKMLADLEIQASSRLAWMSFGVRTGPLLGLMGTLIPMGPALMGLSTGDIEAMAGNLVIVFSTTVVGVFVGGLCYAMLLVRRQWYAQNLADIEFLIGQSAEQDDDERAAKRTPEGERCA